MLARLERLHLWIGATGTLLLIAMILTRSSRIPTSVAIVGFAFWMLSPYIAVRRRERYDAA